MSFLTNLLAFSPLLLLAALILYLLDRADNLRRTLEPVQPPPLQEADLAEEEVEEEDLLDTLSDGEYDYHDDEDVWLPQEEPLVEEDTENPTQPAQPAQPAAAPIPAPDRTPRMRTVGAKKARSLARRDQRRAYHEFLLSEQSERARQAAVVAEEEEEQLFEEKRRRAVAEEEIVAQRQSVRAERAKIERMRDEDQRRDLERVRDTVTVRGGKMAWSLGGLAEMVGREEAWIRAALKSEGLVGGKGAEMRMITEEGWYLVVGEAALKVLYSEIEKKGKMEWGEMAKVLEEAIA